MVKKNVIVVGGGIVGLCTAYYLQKEGHEVTVITSDRYYPIEDYDNAWFPVMGARIRNPGIETVDDYKIIRLPILTKIFSLRRNTG